MTVSELMQYLEQGREIEFSIAEKEFFMSYLDPEKYYIWDPRKKCDLVVGSIDDVFSYLFEEGTTLKDHIEKFSFQYIL